MPKRNIFFETLRPYHIFSRAVDKKEIFGAEDDCLRFLFQTYAANIGKIGFNLTKKQITDTANALLAGREFNDSNFIKGHPPLVYVLSFVLVVDHYHFLLVSETESGIPAYMQKLNNGFAKYFNLKNDRRGILFESRYKIVPVKSDFQLNAVLRYINIINPLDVYQPGWRQRGLENREKALEFLNRYQFSSFPDLFGARKSAILAPARIIKEYLGEGAVENRVDNLRFVEDFLKEKSTVSNPLFLE